ncbi:hypothetical protein [Clostridium fungisolvens]|uniref:Uncharacterized protein n=1 Tax=Clostridium fungisolvens TaxID=1604897 RepID=A0A6V8SML7_9CLOT|nr:hypothetical protein [Clostridium fungisolvens]GFP76418.1 hypothetical protein bsdtw1_02520 [Clostridium fungisolvens]
MNKKNVFLIVLVSIVFGVLNFKVYMIGNKPDLTQGFISIFFIALWLLYGFVMGNKNSKHFVKFITVYWVVGFVLNLITLFFNWFILSIPLSCIFFIPLYGLRYFFREPLSSNFFYIAILITYIAGGFGYFLGKTVKNKLSVKI